MDTTTHGIDPKHHIEGVITSRHTHHVGGRQKLPNDDERELSLEELLQLLRVGYLAEAVSLGKELIVFRQNVGSPLDDSFHWIESGRSCRMSQRQHLFVVDSN